MPRDAGNGDDSALLRALAARAVLMEHGDISENSEYEDAKHRQGMTEGRIRELESILARLEVIEPSSMTGSVVRFGATVTLMVDGDERRYQLVGEHEADTKRGRMSIKAPLARSVIGKEEGDVVYLGEDSEIEIVQVRYD
jgi:transcription elongation factor GreA